MAILTSSPLSFIDITDQKQLSVYLTSNKTTIQVYDEDTNIYNPDWSQSSLVITPQIFLDQSKLQLSNNNLVITWKRKDGNGEETDLTSGESVVNNSLNVNANKFNSAQSDMITYICYVSYTDDDTNQEVNVISQLSYTLIRASYTAKLCFITGPQVFKYNRDGELVGDQTLKLTGNLQNVSVEKWLYYNGEDYVDYPDSNQSISTNEIIVSPDHDIFNSSGVATLKLSTSDDLIFDVISITKIYDGLNQDSYSIILSNEMQSIPTDVLLRPLESYTYSCDVLVYKGINQLQATLPEQVTDEYFSVSLPENQTGMTFKQDTPGVVTFSVNENEPINNQGTIELNINIEGKTNIKKYISYSISKSGSSGVVFSIYAPNGTIFENQSGQIELETIAYYGSTKISSEATYQWEKIGSTGIIGRGSTIQINGDDVPNIATYKCTMTYNGEDYVSSITLEDKTDIYYSEMLTIGGTTFKNGQGGSFVYVIVKANGKEIDPLFGPIRTERLTSKSINENYYYYFNMTNGQWQLYEWSTSNWVQSAQQHSLIYSWLLIDKNGNQNMTFTTKKGNSKIIYLSCDDIDEIGTIQCDVIKND